MTFPTRLTFLILLVAAAAVGCGDDDEPNTPQPPQTLEYPGDGPTFEAVVAMARNGDTVEVGPGMHEVAGTVLVERAITIVGRESIEGGERPTLDFTAPGFTALDIDVDGVEVRGLEIEGDFDFGVRFAQTTGTVIDCEIEDADIDAITFVGSAAGGRVERNILVRAARFGVSAISGAAPEVVQNTIVDTGDCGLYTNDADPMLERNIITRSANFGIACFGDPMPTIGCNVIYESVTADYSASCPDASGDLLADPMLCPESYGVDPASPCVDADGCGWIGAVEETCE